MYNRVVTTPEREAIGKTSPYPPLVIVGDAGEVSGEQEIAGDRGDRGRYREIACDTSTELPLAIDGCHGLNIGQKREKISEFGIPTEVYQSKPVITCHNLSFLSQSLVYLARYTNREVF